RGTLLETDLRLVAQQAARAANVREAVAGVAGPKLAQDVWCDALPVGAHLAYERPGHVENADRGAGADIDRLVVGPVGLQRQHVGAGDVTGVDEVAQLPAVLVDRRWVAGQDARAEDG